MPNRSPKLPIAPTGEDRALLLAVRDGGDILVMHRTSDATGQVRYRCVARGANAAAIQATAPVRLRVAVEQSLRDRAFLEAAMAPAVPGLASGYLPEIGPTGDDLAMTLALCFQAEFFRYVLAAERIIRSALDAPLPTPVRLGPLIRALELATDLGRSDLALDFLHRHGNDLLRWGRGDGSQLAGNRSYFFRLVADCCEVLGLTVEAIEALEISILHGPNRAKETRLQRMRGQPTTPAVVDNSPRRPDSSRQPAGAGRPRRANSRSGPA
jgi:hypothetical protein